MDDVEFHRLRLLCLTACLDLGGRCGEAPLGEEDVLGLNGYGEAPCRLADLLEEEEEEEEEGPYLL